MSIPRTSSAKLLSIMAILSLLVMSSAAAMAEDQTAPLPTWTNGQTWAVGGERDLSNVLGENLATLQDTMTALGNISINQLDVTGTAGAWVVFKVVGVNQDTYLLEYSVGMRIHGELNVQITGEMPREGTYLLSSMTKEVKEVSGEANLDFVVTSHGIATVDKATMGIVSVVSTTIIDESVTLNATNFPNYSTSFNITGISVNMTYEEYAIAQSLHLELNSTVGFAPALPLLKFPLTVGNNWSINSKMTFEGSVEGYLNVTGLPESFMSSLGDNEMAESINFKDLTHLGTMELENGTVAPIESNVQATMQCLGTKTVGDGFGNDITIFDVKEKQSGVHLYYSPETEFLATALMKPQLSMLDEVVSMPGGSIDSLNLNTEISMASTDPVTATNKISDIGSYQGVEPVSLVTSPNSGGSGAVLDSTIMILLVVVILLVAAGVGGIILLRKRKTKGL